MSIRCCENEIEPLSDLLRKERTSDACASDPVAGAHRDPAPQYPPWVIAGCIILTIVLFVWGFVRG